MAPGYSQAPNGRKISPSKTMSNVHMTAKQMPIRPIFPIRGQRSFVFRITAVPRNIVRTNTHT